MAHHAPANPHESTLTNCRVFSPAEGEGQGGARSASAVKSDVKLNHCSIFISLDALSRHEAHADIHQGKAPARYGEMMTEAIRDLRQQHEVLAELSRRSA